ncbi:hypothetical protein PR048_004116 [Dryococelus australis]|uniref:Uncharacterized protein n=1 Tax=Dryococelus australis TaxID=614101 RepID=A0ABQ9I4K7_9NEOP|nr:hypothetical protein PR048_004116 [Dryococelus australis]
MLKTPKSRVTILCMPTSETKILHDDPMPYFPLYALPVNLGAKFFAAILVLQHVESNFIRELYETRETYTVKCIRIVSSTPGLYMAEDDPREETKHCSASSAAKQNVSISKPNDKNANANITDVKNVARNRRLSGDRGSPARRGVDTGSTRTSRREELAGSRNVWVNKDGMLTTRIDASRHDGTLPPRDLRNVLQSRPGHNHVAGLLDNLISSSEMQDLRTVLRGKRMYAERHMDVADDFREERFVDEIIHDRNRNLSDSSFVRSVIPPGAEDLRQVLQEKMMVENIVGDRYERSGEFHGRGQVRVYENNDLRSFIEENRATHKNEGKDSFREFSRLPRDAETWDGARMRVSFRDDLASGRNLYPPDFRGKLHSRNDEPEAFPLVKDSALFERGLDSKTNIRDERRKVMFADIQDMRSSDADLRGSGPGRSFDDAELSRRKPRTDDIASGIQTDVRGINIRAGGWKARDDVRNMESIHDSFSKFDAYLSNVKSSMKNFQHSGKAKPEFNQSFPNAGMKSEWRALSPNLKLQVAGEIRRENPYHDDKPKYFGEGDKSSKAEWFAFNERRAEDGIAERNRVTFKPEGNRIMPGEIDRNRTHIDGGERNRVFGESVSERRIFSGPERTGVSVDGPDDRNRNMFIRAEDRKRQVFETEDRNKQVFSEPNRNSLMFGGSEDRRRPLYDNVEDRKRQMFSEPDDRKRQMYGEPDDRKRQMYGEPDDRKRQMYSEPDDRKRQMYGEPDDRKRQMYGEPDDRKRQMYGEPVDTKRQMYDEQVDRKKQMFGEPDDRNRQLFGEPDERKSQVYVETDDRKMSLYAELEDKKFMYGEPEDRKRSVYDESEEKKRLIYGEPGNVRRSAYNEPGDLIRSAYDEPGDRKRSAYVDPEDRNRSLHSEPVDSKRLKYGELENKRSVYEETGDRKRSVYGGPEDRSGYMFSKTGDRNLPVTERSRPVDEVGQNRPTVEEIERNRLMAGEREREKILFGGRTNINRTGYYAPDSKVASYNRGYAEDSSSFINDESGVTNFSFKDTYGKISQSKEDIRPKIQPGETRQLPPKAEDGDREVSKRYHHHQQQHSLLPPPPPPPLLTDEQMVEVQSTKEKKRRCRAAFEKAQKIVTLKARETQQEVGVPDKQAGGSSATRGKDGKTYFEESSVKRNDAKHLYMGDRSLEKGPQAYWAVDRGREPAASHQTPSSSNREWDKVQSSGGHSSAASWTNSWGQEGRQRDTREQHGGFRSLQPVDTKQPPPSSSQHVGKYRTSDEPGRSTLPSVSTFGQSPQNYEHSNQQYGLSGSVPAHTSAAGMGNMSQYGSWQGGGPGGWNTSSGWSATGGWGAPGAWNTSNNWSSQFGNAGYTWR